MPMNQRLRAQERGWRSPNRDCSPIDPILRKPAFRTLDLRNRPARSDAFKTALNQGLRRFGGGNPAILRHSSRVRSGERTGECTFDGVKKWGILRERRTLHPPESAVQESEHGDDPAQESKDEEGDEDGAGQPREGGDDEHKHDGPADDGEQVDCEAEKEPLQNIPSGLVPTGPQRGQRLPLQAVGRWPSQWEVRGRRRYTSPQRGLARKCRMRPRPNALDVSGYEPDEAMHAPATPMIAYSDHG